MTPQQAKRLGKYLRTVRETKGMSARQMARASGLAHPTILRIEHGEFHEPSPHKLAALADVLELPLADLYAQAGYVAPHELPNFTPYLRAKYGDLPEDAVHEMEHYFARLAARYGYDPEGPAPGADEK